MLILWKLTLFVREWRRDKLNRLLSIARSQYWHYYALTTSSPPHFPFRDLPSGMPPLSARRWCCLCISLCHALLSLLSLVLVLILFFFFSLFLFLTQPGCLPAAVEFKDITLTDWFCICDTLFKKLLEVLKDNTRNYGLYVFSYQVAYLWIRIQLQTSKHLN